MQKEPYVKCLICGKKLKLINWLHLRKHNLTFEQYKQMFPNALTWRSEPKIQYCEVCGKLFLSTSIRQAKYCPKCRYKRRILLTTIRRRQTRKKLKKRKYKLGSISDKKLNEFCQGKIDLQTIMKYPYYSPCSTEHEFIIISENQLYCLECGAKIRLAFPNQYYDTTELCCSKCGLVYSE